MRRHILAAVAALAFFGALLSFGVSGASAAEDCDSVIIDGAQKFGDGRSDVEVAARSLNTLGADVRVRTITSLGRFSTLDHYLAAAQAECDSWRIPGANDPDFRANFKSNFLVFAMSLNDRKVGIFFGGDWEQVFKNGIEKRIQEKIMGPRFGDGDFAGGFVAGMNESHRLIDLYQHPDKTPVPPSGPPVIKEPTDFSGLWRVMGIGLGLLALGALLYFGYTAYTRHRKAEEERKAAQQRALSARDATTIITRAVGDDGRRAVRQSKVNTYSIVEDERGQRLKEALAEVEDNYTAAIDEVQAAAAASGNPEDDSLAAAVYDQLAGRYERALGYARAAQQADELIDELTAEIKAELDRVPQETLTVQAGIDQINADLRQHKGEGIETDGISVDTAQTALNQARENPADLQALVHLGAAQQSLSEAQAALAVLKQQRAQLARDIPALEARITAVKGTIQAAHESFDRVSATYAESSWESVRGNGTEAEKRVAAAEEALAAARTQSSIKQQKWVEAISSIQEGNLLLDKAQSLVRSVTELERNLKVAQKQAPTEIEAAKADIDTAEQYIATYDDDIREELEGDLRKARRLLEQAREELAEQLPDYLRVMKLATDANSAADRIYAEAVGEYEAAERRRRQAASLLTQASAAVSRADEFIEDHDSDVGSDAESNLRSAREALQQAQNYHDPEDVIRYAQNALDNAESAYQDARSDFEAAEAARRRIREAEERRRREAQEAEEQRRARARSSSSSSSFDFGGGRGGGSSSSWGSSGRGGGSSISFGGGRGGGSSSSW